MNPQSSAADALIADALAHGRSALDEKAGKTLLAAYGIRTPRSALATTAADAESLGRRPHSAVCGQGGFP
jgi:hypothetical protein